MPIDFRLKLDSLATLTPRSLRKAFVGEMCLLATLTRIIFISKELLNSETGPLLKSINLERQ